MSQGDRFTTAFFAITIMLIAAFSLQERAALKDLTEKEVAQLRDFQHELYKIQHHDLVSIDEGPERDGLVVVQESMIRTYIVTQLDIHGGARLSYEGHRPGVPDRWIRFVSLSQTRSLQPQITGIVRKRDNPEGWFTLASHHFTQ